MPHFKCPSKLAAVSLFLLSSLLTQQVTAQDFDVVASGSSAFFREKQIISVDASTSCLGNVFDTENVTHSYWVRFNALSTYALTNQNTDVHIVGPPVETGMRLFSTGLHVNYDLPGNRKAGQDCSNYAALAAQHGLSVHPRKGQNLFDDFQWHHIAIASSRRYFYILIDGMVHDFCTVSPNPADELFHIGSILHVGMYDEKTVGNMQGMPGWVDEVRIYSRFLDPSEIVGTMHRTNLTVAEQQGLQLWFDFDTLNAVGTPIDKSPNALKVASPWLYQDRPEFVPSTAPIFGDTLRASVQEMPASGVADVAGTPTTAVVSLTSLSSAPVLSGAVNLVFTSFNMPDASAGSILSQNGSVILGNAGASISLNSLILPGSTQFSFRPAIGAKARDTAVITATAYLSNGTDTSAEVDISVFLLPNRSPVTGTSGYAISCDGVDDYLANYEFEWPVGNFTNKDTNQTVFGASPVTIEWWGYITAASQKDSAVFTIGNGEMLDSWVGGFDPYSRLGRFLGRVPFSNGQMQQMIGSEVDSDVSLHLNRWNHFAMVNDQAGGNYLKNYVNGKLVGTSTVSSIIGTNPGFNKVKSVMICSWSFWSEVYHYGLIDEFRVWNVSRTQSQIQANMYQPLSGNEANLMGYWNFDHDTDPTVASDSLTRPGTTPHDLQFGGCAPCDDYNKGWMPYNSFYGVYPPSNASLQDPLGSGYRTCLPSAKSSDSPYFLKSIVYGSQHCFGDNKDPSTYPTRITSTAPMGGNLYDQSVASGSINKSIALNGTDPDGTPLRFRIVHTISPTLGTLSYSQDSGINYVLITADNTLLPYGVTSVYFTPVANAGGQNFASFDYAATDGLTASATSTVKIHVFCAPGSYVNSATKRCVSCTAGSYTANTNTDTSCRQCPANTFAETAGMTTCASCDSALEFSNAGASSCSDCSTLPSISSANGIINAQDIVCQRKATIKVDEPLTFSLAQYTSAPSTSTNIYLRGLPGRGSVRQVNNGEVGDNLLESFTSVKRAITQYPIAVLSSTPTSSGAIGNTSALLGPPDVPTYVSDASTDQSALSKSWSPEPSSSGEFVVIQVAQAVYVQSVTVYETYAPGSVVEVAAQNPTTGVFHILWAGNAAKAGVSRQQFQPDSCFTPFATTVVRVQFRATQVGGRIDIDSIGVTGSLTLKQLPLTLLSDPTYHLAYELSSKDLASSQTLSYSDSFTFVVRTCNQPFKTTASIMTSPVLVALQFKVEPKVDVASTSVAGAFLGLSAFGIVWCLTLLAILFSCRNHVVIRAASYPFLVLVCVSSLIFFLRALLYNVQFLNDSADTCMAQQYLFGAAFSWLFGSLFVKTYRIFRIFGAKTFGVLKLPDQLLFALAAILYSIDLFIKIAWEATNKSRFTDTLNGVQLQYDCSTDDGLNIAAMINHLVLAFAVVVLSILVRNTPSRFNETKANAFVAYNTLIFLGLTTALLQLFSSSSTNARIVILNLGVQGTGYAASCVLIAYRIWMVYFGDIDPDTSSKIGQSSFSAAPGPVAPANNSPRAAPTSKFGSVKQDTGAPSPRKSLAAAQSSRRPVQIEKRNSSFDGTSVAEEPHNVEMAAPFPPNPTSPNPVSVSVPPSGTPTELVTVQIDN